MSTDAVVFLAGLLVAAGALLAVVVYIRRRALQSVQDASDWELPPQEIDLTMVVPYFNPGPELRTHIEELVTVLRNTGVTFEVIAVSDGSTDGSDRDLVGLFPDELYSVALKKNSGKGEALRIGLAMGRGRYLGFIDADGDVAPTTLESFLALVKLYEPAIILGSKRHPMSDVKYPPLRRVYSWGYQQLIRLLFNLNVRDTQTGIKLVRRDVAADVLPRMLEKRFAFDLELFVVARRLGFKDFFEAPIKIDFKFRSTISMHAVWGMFLDTLAIFYRLRLLHYYDAPRRTLERPSVIPPQGGTSPSN